MDIIIGRTAYANRDSSQNKNSLYNSKKKKKEDRRKNKQDRRKSARDGVIVTISTKNERRVLRDRRKRI